MEDIYYIFCERPLSHNRSHSGTKLTDYKNGLALDFHTNFENLYRQPFCRGSDTSVMTEILYFEGIRYQKTDIDNLSKPIVDAFKGILYEDDGQVVRRTATKVNTFTYGIDFIDITDLPAKVVTLYNKWRRQGKEHITILKVSDINLADFRGKLI